jgi:hypothetical protein
MKTRSWLHLALAMPALVLSQQVLHDGSSSLRSAPRILVSDDVYIKQAHGRVSPGTKILTKPVPEAGLTAATPNPGPTAPATCDAQNASSPACYTATQQTRGR